MTRFQLWPRPTAYPYFDIVNRDTEPGPVFDLGIDLDGYDGSVFIKPDAIMEMARTLGMADKETVAALVEENKRLNRLVNALPEEAKVLEDGLAALVADFHDRLSARADSVDEVRESVDAEIPIPVVREEGRSESGDDSLSFLDDVGADKASGQSDSISSVKRPASVRGDSKPKRLEI